MGEEEVCNIVSVGMVLWYRIRIDARPIQGSDNLNANVNKKIGSLFKVKLIARS